MSHEHHVLILPRTQAYHRQVSLTLDIVQQLFHLRQDKAAAQLGVCLTSFKAACRRLGIKRWPFTRTQGCSRRSDQSASRQESARQVDENLVAFFQPGPVKEDHCGESSGKKEEEDAWVGMGREETGWVEWYMGATDGDPVVQRWGERRGAGWL
eukprot:182825-Hanusia_phi.AAC.1